MDRSSFYSGYGVAQGRHPRDVVGETCTNLIVAVVSLVTYKISSFIKKCKGHGYKFKLVLNFEIVLDLNCQVCIGPPSCCYSVPPW